MTYQNSPHHIENLNIARKKAKTTECKCTHCSEDIVKSGHKRHEKYCYLNPSNIKICPVCSNPIKNYKTGTTCSYSCSNTLFRSGENNGMHSKSPAYQTICFNHHEKKCVVCSEDKIVEVHHYDENHDNNDPKNLVPLCPTHHKYWHSRYRHLIEDAVKTYYENWSG